MRTGAILVAAGSSQRMGGVDKLLLSLAGRPVLAHSLSTIAEHPRIDDLIVVASPANIESLRTLAEQQASRARVVLGGPRRRDSVLNGLEALWDCDYVLVHDGARPLLTAELVDAALDGAVESGASLCAVPVSDTVKRADDAGFVRSTVARHDLWLAQTPQAFRFETLRRAHASSDIDVTDDCALVELLGEPVCIVTGSQRNLKITTAADLALAEALLTAEAAGG